MSEEKEELITNTEEDHFTTEDIIDLSSMSADEKLKLARELAESLDLDVKPKKKTSGKYRTRKIGVPVTDKEYENIQKNSGKKYPGQFLRELGLRNKHATIEHVYTIDPELLETLKSIATDARNGGNNHHRLVGGLAALLEKDISDDLEVYIAELADPVSQLTEEFAGIRKGLRMIFKQLEELSTKGE